MSSFKRIDIDARMLAALQAGDRSAAAEVYRVLADVVFTLALRLLADRQLATEAMQDTFVVVIEHAASVATPEAFVGWVRSVAVNQCLMRLRSPWHRRRVAWMRVEHESLAEPIDDMSEAQRLDGLADVERALARLAPKTRFVVWMHDVEGYTHAEIAQLIGKTASYSKSQLARGHARLLAETEKQCERDAASTERPIDSGCAAPVADAPGSG